MDNQNNVIFSCEGISKTFGGVRAKTARGNPP